MHNFSRPSPDEVVLLLLRGVVISEGPSPRPRLNEGVVPGAWVPTAPVGAEIVCIDGKADEWFGRKVGLDSGTGRAGKVLENVPVARNNLRRGCPPRLLSSVCMDGSA